MDEILQLSLKHLRHVHNNVFGLTVRYTNKHVVPPVVIPKNKSISLKFNQKVVKISKILNLNFFNNLCY